MKNLAPLFLVLFFLFACNKNDEIITPSSDTIDWRAYSVTTTPASEITSFTATSGGTIGSSGGGNSTSERGICYNTSPYPTISNFKIASGAGAGTFTCVMPGLSSNTLYYVRAYAIKSGVTTYGNQVTFTTYANPGTVTDIDGNVYQTINIGGQIWMAENLKTTHYRDGAEIPLVPGDLDWFNQTSGAYCLYNNDSGVAATYGKLYNWYAATDAHNIAPAGYHVPTLAEWDVLRNYLGGLNVAGGKAKESGLTHWITPNTGATNSSGFNSIPGGARFVNLAYPSQGSPAFFSGLNYYSDWWTTTTSGSNAQFVETNYNTTEMYRSVFIGSTGYYDKRTGYAIRCIKD